MNLLNYARCASKKTLCSLLFVGLTLSAVAQAQQIDWSRTLNGSGDGAWAMATHDNRIYVLAATGSQISCLRPDGSVIWRSPVLNSSARGFAISVNDSGIYVAGRVVGAMPGQSAIGLADAFAVRYGFDGNPIWIRQFGTPDGEAAFGIAVSKHGLYIAGGPAVPYRFEPAEARTAFLRKYSIAGDFDWQRLDSDPGYESYGFAVATSDTDVFLAGTRNGARLAYVSRFTSEGRTVWTHERTDDNPFSFDVARSVAVSASGDAVYFGGYANATSWGNTSTGNWQSDGPATAFVEKLSGDGVLLWHRSPVSKSPGQIIGTTLRNEELYVSGFGSILDATGTEIGQRLIVEKLGATGARLWKRRFSVNRFDQGKAVATLGSSVIVAGESSPERSGNASQTRTLVSRLTDPAAPETRYRLSDLGDINDNGAADIGIFINESPTTFIVKDTATGATINQFHSTDSARTVAVSTVADVNRNEAPEVLWLRDYPIRIEGRDSLTGEFIQDFSFDGDYQALDMAVIYGPGPGRSPGIAILENGSMRVERRELLTGDLIGFNYFDPRFVGKRIFVQPDQNGNGAQELAALLLDNPGEGSDKLEVRDSLTNELLRQIWLGNSFTARDAVRLPGSSVSGESEIAVLREQTSSGSVNIIVANTASGASRPQIAYNPGYAPIALLALSDMNGNDSVELGVLGVHRSDGSVRLEIRDSQTRRYVRSVYFGKQFVPLDVIALKDMNGNGVDEVAVLGRRDRDGLFRVTISDARLNRTLQVINFRTARTYKAKP